MGNRRCFQGVVSCALISGLAALAVALPGHPAVAASEDFSGWVEYRSPDGAFKISFPSTPVVETSSDNQTGTTIKMTTIMTSNGAFAIVVHEPETPGGGATDPLDRLTRQRQGTTLDYVRVISLGTMPGRET